MPTEYPVKICYCCGFVHSPLFGTLNIVLYRVPVNELVCTNCYWDIPDYIDESQFKNFLDIRKRRCKDV